MSIEFGVLLKNMRKCLLEILLRSSQKLFDTKLYQFLRRDLVSAGKLLQFFKLLHWQIDR